MRILIGVLVAAVALGGCGGGEKQEHLFTAADAIQVARVSPATPGWGWPRDPKKPGDVPTSHFGSAALSGSSG
jgi:hypothetical protein